ncbi:PQQ-dependent sugar dehydrogenase [Neopusillimonas aestuarii]|uniref:PQQ-dependent sugar dehydrogenase n=1 Tax=Neopusillimonas aestuarii TaxID=2716226 RepID=UPI001D18D499|nr:PQQ-dependent sugar dehydrogenase [Pusillimonas sp. DMV24BSW_D]
MTLSHVRAAEIEVEELAQGLQHPWGMAFLPDNQGMLVTEREGSLRHVSSNGQVSDPINGVPEVWNKGQGGLLDIALAPNFKQSRNVYLSYSEGGSARAGTAVGFGKLSNDMRQLEGFKVIFRQEPKMSTGQHFGSRLVFDNRGHLYITLGDNGQRPLPQDLDKLQGKVVRILADGTIPSDNPFVRDPMARDEIWTYGHRNPQGAALHPESGLLWINEHGPRGGDEINIPKAGKNYGWPIATHGINYSGSPIPEAKGEQVKGTEAPNFVWEVSPAVSGMAFYTGERFPQWQGSIFVGALRDRSLIRLTQNQDGVIEEQERLLKDLNERIRDVRSGPDGFIYVLTDADNGRLLRIGLQ